MAVNKPAVIDSATLQKYTGTFGDRVFTIENGKLYYQRSGRPRFEMEPMATRNLMKAKGNQFFKIEFIENEKGDVNNIKAFYQTGVIDSAWRTQ